MSETKAIDLAAPLPSNADLEAKVLGFILERGIRPEIADALGKPETFALEAHQLIYKAILALEAANTPVSVTTVWQAMQREGTSARIEGQVALFALQHRAEPSVDLAEDYAKKLRDIAYRRNLILELRSALQEAQDGRLKGEEVAARHDERLLALNQGIDLEKGFRHHSEAGAELYSEYERLWREGKTDGISTGLKNLDAKLRRWRAPNLIVAAAPTAAGKSAFALAIALNVLEQGKAVAIYSAEMSEFEVKERWLNMKTGINSGTIERRETNSETFPRIKAHLDEVAGLPLYVYDQAGVTPSILRRKARQRCKRDKIDLLIVDYLQLLEAEGRRENRTQEVGAISRALKALAKDLNLPILALAQLNREAEQDRPSMRHIRESGAIEQDADVVMLIHRPEARNENKMDWPSDAGEPPLGYGKIGFWQGKAEVIIAKQRNGPTGSAFLSFDAARMLFSDLPPAGAEPAATESTPY